jgi:hypothetical protein
MLSKASCVSDYLPELGIGSDDGKALAVSLSGAITGLFWVRAKVKARKHGHEVSNFVFSPTVFSAL